MAKLKSFEQYVAEMDRSEEIEDGIVQAGEPEGKDVEEVEDEADEVQANESSLNEEETEEESIPVSEMLENCFAQVKEEAKVWESDAHDDHTIEKYMVENAALVASLASTTLSEMKEDMDGEAYEACLNQMVEAYTKKCNEYKESYGTPDGGQDIE